MKLKILIILTFICIILFIYITKHKELFENIDTKYKNHKLQDLFTSDIFNGKDIFLIANNDKLSKKTQDFLEKYRNNNKRKNYLVVRFNGYKPYIKDYMGSEIDIMVYNIVTFGFFGYNLETYNPNIINIFTINNYLMKYKKYCSIDSLIKHEENKNQFSSIKNILLKNKYYINVKEGLVTKKTIPTNGFNMFYNLYNKQFDKIKKLYLIGFTFPYNEYHKTWNEKKIFNEIYNKNKGKIIYLT